ncbi:MAG TPA: hypothetical protein VFH61_11345 [Thermoleophilia bacterium]|nr:hypothetical protein [Thermoleophilia bacterium]
MKLTAQTVSKTVSACLFTPEELVPGSNGAGYVAPEGAIVVHGITVNLGFHPERLEAQRSVVERLLGELPLGFRAEKGGGWSFLNACEDKHGNHWGEHRDVELLFLLGEALGLARPMMPRAMWAMFPGGMPYYVVTLRATANPDGRT